MKTKEMKLTDSDLCAVGNALLDAAEATQLIAARYLMQYGAPTNNIGWEIAYAILKIYADHPELDAAIRSVKEVAR